MDRLDNNLEKNGRALENAFFLKQEQRLVESLREMVILEQTTGLLGEVSGIKNPAVLARLAQLKVTPAAAASLAIVPLVSVAWSDGLVSAAERQAILAGLDKVLFFQTIDRDIIDVWLSLKPSPALIEAWEAYVKPLVAQLSSAEAKALGNEVLSHARLVAQSAGTFLGLGGISKAEQLVLDRLERGFTPSPASVI